MNADFLRFGNAYQPNIAIYGWLDLHLEREPLADRQAPMGTSGNGEQRGSEVPTGRAPSQKPLLPPPASKVRAQVVVVLSGEVAEFDASQQASFRLLLARYVKISPSQISLIRIEPGSVLVTVELPESTARWLIQVHQRRELLAQMLDIQDVRDLRVLPQPGIGARLKRLLHRFVFRSDGL